MKKKQSKYQSNFLSCHMEKKNKLMQIKQLNEIKNQNNINQKRSFLVFH